MSARARAAPRTCRSRVVAVAAAAVALLVAVVADVKVETKAKAARATRRGASCQLKDAVSFLNRMSHPHLREGASEVVEAAAAHDRLGGPPTLVMELQQALTDRLVAKAEQMDHLTERDGSAI
mmetsp:Transcript_49668/g.118304  ORF Transcript_49668/g.118304 Transcript_49668/m.118304 type:complete len:123 (+) Transcript_49668:208-576(+)